jgi:hypothetical protein
MVLLNQQVKPNCYSTRLKDSHQIDIHQFIFIMTSGLSDFSHQPTTRMLFLSVEMSLRACASCYPSAEVSSPRHEEVTSRSGVDRAEPVVSRFHLS